MSGSILFAAALLLLVFVPVLRRCAWRTAAALTLVCATVTAVGPMIDWSQSRWEPAAVTAGPNPEGRPATLVGGIQRGPAGTHEGFLGEFVRLLGAVAALLTFLLVRRSDPANLASVREPALASAILLAIGATCALFDFSWLALSKPIPDREGNVLILTPAAGLELTLLAAITGTACAARAFVLLRRAFQAAQAQQRQEEVF